jgi:hypothetical protein
VLAAVVVLLAAGLAAAIQPLCDIEPDDRL